MSCHEVAALRLALMQVLGQNDEAERQHEIAELGDALERPGPLRALASAKDLESVTALYASALSDLATKVAATPASDSKLPYLRTLLVLTKNVEHGLRAHVEGLARFQRELEEIHDYVHEIYPAKG